MEGTFDTAQGTLTLDVRQSTPPTPGQPEKKPLHIPLALGLVGPDGADLPLVLATGEEVQSGVIELRAGQQSFTFTGLPGRPILSLNRGFSAPVNLTSGNPAEELSFSPPMTATRSNRFDAIQSLALRLIREGAISGQAADAAPLIQAAARILDDARLDPAFKAQALALPGEGEVGAGHCPERGPGRGVCRAAWPAPCAGQCAGTAASARFTGRFPPTRPIRRCGLRRAPRPAQPLP